MTAPAAGAPVPTQTRTSVLHGPGDLRLHTRPVPAPGPGEVLLRIAAVGLCGSDLHYVADGSNGTNVLRSPSVLGHEASGTVVGTGPDVRLEPGTPIAIEPAVGCGACARCRSGRYNLCPTGSCLGSPPTDGVLGEFAVVRARHITGQTVVVDGGLTVGGPRQAGSPGSP